MKPLTLLIDSVTVAAVMVALSAWFHAGGHSVAQPASESAEGRAWLLLLVVLAAVWRLVDQAADARRRRLAEGGWWGADAWLRQVATPVALGSAIAVVAWGLTRAAVGTKLGGFGSLLILTLVVASGVKLVAETYLFSKLGGEPSPRQRTAQMLIGSHSFAAKARYTLGALGGIVLPLGAQILAGGSKHIPAVSDAGPPAVLACAALVCLVPGELLERWLFWRAVGDEGEATSDAA